MNGEPNVVGPEFVRVQVVDSRAGLEAAWGVRFEVFVDEQQVPVEEEVDAADTADTTTHVLVVAPDGTAIGTGRLLIDPAHPAVLHIGRLAVRAAWRKAGIGAILMSALEGLAADTVTAGTPVRVELSAQEQAIGFYERLGYTIEGERYLDAKIWHRDAWKVLDGTR